MQCEEFQRFAEAYVDGEFDAFGRAEIEAHLASCDPCRALARHLDAYRSLMATESRPVEAPDALRARIHDSLENIELSRPWTRWATVGTATVAALLLLFLQFNRASSPDFVSADLTPSPIVEASVDWHRRNLPVEVTGPDTDVIRAWFMDKVDFPVRLPTFDASLQSSVLGGRLNQLNNQSAAHLVYEVEGSKVSVILFNANSIRVPHLVSTHSARNHYFVENRQGYHVAVFQEDGVTYAITTEMPEPSFNAFVSSVDFGH